MTPKRPPDYIVRQHQCVNHKPPGNTGAKEVFPGLPLDKHCTTVAQHRRQIHGLAIGEGQAELNWGPAEGYLARPGAQRALRPLLLQMRRWEGHF
eukprot:7136500-Lingulodinium_polyedra.AAC.1